MRAVIGIILFTLALLRGATPTSAWAEDAEVRYVITNGGEDVGPTHGSLHFFPAGKRDGAVDWSDSGAKVLLPEGTYDVQVEFRDDAARKEIWLKDQHFAGKVDRTVEVDLPMTEVTYVITNGGTDVGRGHGSVRFFRPRERENAVSWGDSGNAVRLPAGDYDIHVEFNDDAAHRAIWLPRVTLAGKVEKTFDIDIPITQVRYIVTNDGADVGSRASVHFYQVGKRDDAISREDSGGTVRMPAGRYDVHVEFVDGAVRKDMWFENQTFSGAVDRVVEVAVAMTDVRFTITNDGADVAGNGQVHFYPAGKREGAIAWANSGGAVRIPEGDYNVEVSFSDGGARKEIWLENQTFSGKVERTVEVSLPIADVRYLITNGGADVGAKGQVHYFPAEKRDGAIAWAGSGGSVRLPQGSYNVQVTFDDGAAHREKWLENQNFAGMVRQTVEVGLAIEDVRFVVTNSGIDTGQRSQVYYFVAGKRDTAVARTSSGGTARLPEGRYDVQLTFTDGLARKEIWIQNQNFNANINRPVELNLALAEPTVTVTRQGLELGTEASVTYFDSAEKHEFGTVESGRKNTVEAGTYSIRAKLGAEEGWLRGVSVTGSPGVTIAVQPRAVKAPTQTQTPTFAFTAPAATREQITPERGEFPYLPPLPGSTPTGGKADRAPFYVRVAEGAQPDIVAEGSVIKCYQPPQGTVGAAVVTPYRGALLKAGWTMLNDGRQGDAALTVHYGRQGRNIWAAIRPTNQGYCISVTDATIAEDKFAAELSANCHLALTGVLFDYEQSTLKPESDAILEQVSALLLKNPSLKLEIQDHSDNVNQPLSVARARAVLIWLGGHGIAADRLTARGNGQTKPMAANGSDEERARSRRVEITNPVCRSVAR